MLQYTDHNTSINIPGTKVGTWEAEKITNYAGGPDKLDIRVQTWNALSRLLRSFSWNFNWSLTYWATSRYIS